MTGVKQGLRSLMEDPNKNSNPSLDNSPFSNSAAFSSDQAPIILHRSSGRVVSLWTCSKLCAVGFILGVFVGFTLKQRVRRWAGKILRRLKDD